MIFLKDSTSEYNGINNNVWQIIFTINNGCYLDQISIEKQKYVSIML